MEPLVPPHAVGLVGVMLLGVDGVSIAITLIVAGRDSRNRTLRTKSFSFTRQAQCRAKK